MLGNAGEGGACLCIGKEFRQGELRVREMGGGRSKE